MEETERKTDRRVIKTKRAIRNAFAKLLYEKDIDKITIKDIAETADINRKTFYNYYSGVYQIIDEIENEVIEALDAAVIDSDFGKAMQNPYEVFDKITDILNSDLDFYGYLLGMKGNVSLMSKVTELLKEKIKAAVLEQMEMDSEKLDIAVEYAVSGMTAAYRNWFNSGRKQSLEEVSKIIGQICFNGAGALLNNA